MINIQAHCSAREKQFIMQIGALILRRGAHRRCYSIDAASEQKVGFCDLSHAPLLRNQLMRLRKFIVSAQVSPRRHRDREKYTRLKYGKNVIIIGRAAQFVPRCAPKFAD